MKLPTCETCPYWDKIRLNCVTEHSGQCRKNPPELLLETADGTETFTRIRRASLWPVTISSHYCGEHPDFPEYLQARKDGTAE